MKKKALAIVLALVLCISLLPAGALTASAAVYRTSIADDYIPGTILEIYSAEDLVFFGELLKTDRGVNARLMEDIDLYESPELVLKPLAGYYIDGGYNGTFDGNGHTISGIWYGPLFDTIAPGGVVRDLTIYADPLRADAFFAHTSYGTLNNCHAVGSLIAEDEMYVGGLVASVEGGAILNCTAMVDITASASEEGYLNFGYYEVGGIAGYLDGCIDNCTNFGNITLSGYVPGCGINVGGVAAFISFYEPILRNSGNHGSITIDVRAGDGCEPGPLEVGGVVGNVNSDLPPMNCFNTGNISINFPDGEVRASGIVGDHYYYQRFENCWSSGDVSISSAVELPTFYENADSTRCFVGEDAALGVRTGKLVTETELTDGTLLAKLNAYVDANGDGTLFEWTQTEFGPVPEGMGCWVPFIDVAATDYFFHPVIWAVESKVTTGTTATTFSPYETCTQAQILTFLWRAAGEPEPFGEENPYPETLSEDMYCYKPILWAYYSYMIADPQFDPNRECDRFSAVYYLWCVAGCPDATSPSPFTDVEDEFLANVVSWAVEAGVTTGTSATTFSPGETCTRGQIVTFLHRFFSQLPEDHHIFW